MTPISETIVLTPQLVGSNVYDHIRNMIWSNLPAYLLTLAIFFGYGLVGDAVAPPAPLNK